MDINLSLLHSHSVEKIDITGTYTIPKDYYEKTDIIELKNIEVCGKIYLGVKEDDYNEETDSIKCSIKGNMILSDSISLEPIEYPFSIEYDDIIEESCKKTENILDIFAFLWENIVLEVPLQYTKVENLKDFHGDGWRLVSEDEVVNTNNPFKDLLSGFEKE